MAIKLWYSWEDHALVLDPAAGIFADTDRVHGAAHTGETFEVRGPLNTPRPPQGRPVLAQAGSSADGIAFAARYAEAVFAAQQTLADGQALRRAQAGSPQPAVIRTWARCCRVSQR